MGGVAGNTRVVAFTAVAYAELWYGNDPGEGTIRKGLYEQLHWVLTQQSSQLRNYC